MFMHPSNTVCSPDEFVIMDGDHKHWCGNCGFAWKHGPENKGNREAHVCARCGEIEVNKHWSPEEMAIIDMLEDMYGEK